MNAGIELLQATNNNSPFNTSGVGHPAPITLLPNVLCYLSFVGSPTPTIFSWSITTSAGYAPILASTTSPAPTFTPSSGWAGSVILQDEHNNVYVLDITIATSAPVSASNSILYATNYGVKADGRKITDGIMTAGSNVLQSASAAFTSTDVGKSVLLTHVPLSPLPTGTVTLSSGNVLIAGAGTLMLTEIPNVSNIPVNGGSVFCDGEYFAILAVQDNTTLHVKTAPTHNSGAGKTLYRETQLSTTIASVTDATHAVLAVAGASVLVSQTGVLATLGTDDTASCLAAETAAWGAAELIYPAGLICVSSNRSHLNKTGFRGRGQGKEKTIFVDLRTASLEYPVGSLPNNGLGFLSFTGCTEVHCYGMSYDGSVPVLGMQHTTGGISNNSGGRAGFFTSNCENTSFVECGYERFGARDEHFVSAAVVGVNQRWENCGPASPGATTNNNSINPGGVGKGCVIFGCTLNSGYSCIQWAGIGATISNNDLSQITGFTEGNGADPIVLQPGAGGRCYFANNTIRDVDSHGFGSGIINVDGVNSDASCVIDIVTNFIVGNTGYFFNSNSGIFRLNNGHKGTINLVGNLCDKNTASNTGGTFVSVEGTTYGVVYVKDNIFRGRAGSNMTRGIVAAANVPNSAIIDGGGNLFGESVTQTWALGSVTAVGRMNIPVSAIDVVITSFGGSPESNVVGSPGAYCADTTNGDGYIKTTGISTTTGWKKITHA